MKFRLKHQIVVVLTLNTAHEYVIVSSKNSAKSSLLYKDQRRICWFSFKTQKTREGKDNEYQ